MNNHPIELSTDLADQWYERWKLNQISFHEMQQLAARWGSDQELEACCEWFVRDWTDVETADKLRAARRPNGPSLAKQALAAARIELSPNGKNGTLTLKALERLKELEGGYG